MRARYTIPSHVSELLAWRGRVVARTPANVVTLLRFLPWSGALRWDAARRRVAVVAALPWQRDLRGWNDIDDAAVQRRLHDTFGASFGVPTVRAVVELYAQMHPLAINSSTEVV